MINPHPTPGPAALVAQAPRIHGGPGANGPARFDFSTTANACGPCPMALAALREADYGHYPDPAYTALRQQLAALHQVAPGRLVLAASASEFIFRITAVSGTGPVAVPVQAFGDYATAARGHGREVVHTLAGASLAWFTDPASPSGEAVARPEGFTPLPASAQPDSALPDSAQPDSALPDSAQPDSDQPDSARPASAQPVWAVLDRACEPLRLEGVSAWVGAGADDVFQLYSPNKALGLTGVRAAYAIAPVHGEAMVQRLEVACPSWPLGAAGVALLTAWASPAVQHWLADARHTLRGWKLRQTAGFAGLGWQVQPSVSNYGLLRPPVPPGMDAATYATQVVEPALAQAGVAWRNATSFGLPGAWRVSVQPPVAQDHVWAVLQRLQG